MKQLQIQLKSISKSLVSLSKQVEKITKHVEKLQPAKKAPAKKAAAKKVVAKKAPARKKAAAAGAKTVLDSVLDVIKRSRKGASIAELRSKTKLDARQLSNALYKLSKKGMVKTKARGLYVKK
jgi:predicted Rossmann fold nucleotide-binding protein DprA/Smf involved in DNA uptake